MDETMQDEPPTPSRSRKRSSAWITEEENQFNDDEPIEANDTPSKRLLNSRGRAIHSRPRIRYNAQKLLNHLAFTRVYVTANFQNFNPGESFIILAMVSEQNAIYQALCQILSSLYTTSPRLQALAITDGYVNPNSISDQTLLRLLPLVTTAGMEVTVVEEFEAFRGQVCAGEDGIAVIDYRGVCVWNSSDLVDANTPSSVTLENLQKALINALGGGESKDVAMSNG